MNTVLEGTTNQYPTIYIETQAEEKRRSIFTTSRGKRVKAANCRRVEFVDRNNTQVNFTRLFVCVRSRARVYVCAQLTQVNYT